MGIHPRVEIDNLENIERYLDLGVRDFSLSTDLVILYRWLMKNGKSLRKVLSKI